MARQLIFDTTVLIDYERDRIDRAQFRDDDIAISSVSVAEFTVSVELADSDDLAARRRARTQEVLELFDALLYTPVTAAHHARLIAAARRVGRPRGPHDLIIAAHAVETGRTIVSNDASARFGDLPGVAAIEPVR